MISRGIHTNAPSSNVREWVGGCGVRHWRVSDCPCSCMEVCPVGWGMVGGGEPLVGCCGQLWHGTAAQNTFITVFYGDWWQLINEQLSSEKPCLARLAFTRQFCALGERQVEHVEGSGASLQAKKLLNTPSCSDYIKNTCNHYILIIYIPVWLLVRYITLC